MTYIKECPFCGSEEVILRSWETGHRKLASVLCAHCEAKGPSYNDLVKRDGTFEESLESLEEQARDNWNTVPREWEGRWFKIRRFFTQLCYDLTTRWERQ